MSEEKKEYEKINFTFPVLIQWIIEDEILSDSKDFRFTTKTYNVPGFPWYGYCISFESKLELGKVFIICCRCGLEEEEEAITLNEERCEWKSNLCLTINNGEPKNVSQNFKDDEILLYEGPFEKSNSINLRLNGSITVHEIIRKEEHYAFIPSSSEFEKLKEPFDFIIEVENQKIQVHKKVLQFYSPVFSAMFENGWKETIEGRVVIPEFPFKIVKTAIEMCYGEWILSKTENAKLILLYHFADKYDMDEIKHTIKEVIMLSPNNICEYANLFHAENCPVFVNHCIDRLIVYFQFSYPVKDLETLNNDIKLQFFNQASVSQAMKKEFNPDYHKNLNDEDCEQALPLF